MKKIILVTLLILLLGLPAFAAEDAPDTPAAISAADLYNKELDEARQLYGEGLFTVKGIATYVGPDMYGLPAIELSDSKDGSTYVLAVLPFSDFFKLGDVPTGVEVTVQGDPRGKAGDGMFILKQCTIISQ